MSADAVRSAVDALNQGDLDSYGAAFWPDAMRVVPGISEPVSVAATLDQLRELHRAFGGFRLDAVLMIESAPYVVVRWQMTGVHRGEFYGLAASGRRVNNESCEIYEFHEGRVIRSWAYGDPSALALQLAESSHDDV